MTRHSTHNRQAEVKIKSHPDCRACEARTVEAERQIVANGALRLQVMDLRALIVQMGGQLELSEYDRARGEPVDHLAAACCTHGRALSAQCRRCGSQREEQHGIS